jgi:hypothetical protein
MRPALPGSRCSVIRRATRLDARRMAAHAAWVPIVLLTAAGDMLAAELGED